MKSSNPHGVPSTDRPPTSSKPQLQSITYSTPTRHSARRIGLSAVFLSLLASFAVLIVLLVHEGAPLALALVVPPAIIGAAASAVAILKNLSEGGPANNSETHRPPDEPHA